MINLNEQQELAADHLSGPCLVTSVPGSGKTRVLVERTIRLIQKGVTPKNILCITFTNKAANEMKKRIYERVGSKDIGMFVGTFHALCANIVRAYGSRIGYGKHVTIMDTEDQKAMIRKIVRMMGISKEQLAMDIENIIYNINMSRENVESRQEMLDRFDNPNVVKIVEEYFDKIKKSNLIDFSGLLYETINIIQNNQDIRDKLQNLFKYIQVDEVQDTNNAQYTIINLLSEKNKNIMLIGDISQSIYRFRGARYQNIIDFLSTYPDCKKITLGKNYRSTPEIIKVADKLIKNNKSHMVDKFETDNDSGSRVICQVLTTQSDEADWVKKKINEFVEDSGWDYSDIAILYRLNKLSLDLEMSLSKDGIPYCVIGGPSYFDRKEIKDCLSMLGFVINRNDSVSFHRISKIFNDIGDKTIGEIEKYALDNNIDIYESCVKLKDSSSSRIKKLAKNICDIYGKDFASKSPGVILSELVNDFNYFNHLELNQKQEKEAFDRKENVNELIINATDFGNSNSNISDYLNNIALITNNDTESKENSITLMTCHAAKGLEFPIVFMVGMESDILPHELAIKEGNGSDDPSEAMEEERRICYVGMTRAMKHLLLSYCRYRKFRTKTGIINKPKKPSNFLLESGLLSQNEYKNGY